MSNAPSVQRTISPEFAMALVKVQGSIEGAVKGSTNPAFRSKYADLGACWEACRDALQAQNIAVLQFPTAAAPGFVGLTGTLVFGKTGETLSETYQLPVKDASSAQAYGSAITYARRYQLCAMIGISPVDDDGNLATKVPKETKLQALMGPEMTQVPATWIARFTEASSKDARKALYSHLTNSQVAEPAKTEVLTSWANVIKGMK